jgi:hypothetical protein
MTAWTDDRETTALPADVPAAVSRFALELHAAVGSEGHVVSGLGLWLLAALTAPLAQGDARGEVENALGLDSDTAAAAARVLLGIPHPAVRSALAAWTAPAADSAALRAWAGGLPPAAELGPLPTQAAADAWTAEHTGGLIERFPLPLDPATLLTLASVLAANVTWTRPFELADSALLGGPWASRVPQVLSTGTTRQVLLVDTAAAGIVAVHQAHSRDGLTVISVVADNDTHRERVLHAAYDLATTDTSSRTVTPGRHRAAARQRAVSLFDLPLGEGHSWTLTEEPTLTTHPQGREEAGQALLPAWTQTTSTGDLAGLPKLGLGAAASGLFGLLTEPGGPPVSATVSQSATAAYSREGFAAAALSETAVRLGPRPSPREGVRRTLHARFARPYAVVAVASEYPDSPEAREAASVWHGVPVFGAWVTEPADPG